MKDGGEAKFWLHPEVRVARSSGLDAKTLRQLARIVADRAAEIEEARAMSISAESVRFDEDVMWVHLTDGRILGVPLAWFPRLMEASSEARARVTISAYGLHWEELDEDISVSALLAGEAGSDAAA